MGVALSKNKYSKSMMKQCHKHIKPTHPKTGSAFRPEALDDELFQPPPSSLDPENFETPRHVARNTRIHPSKKTFQDIFLSLSSDATSVICSFTS